MNKNSKKQNTHTHTNSLSQSHMHNSNISNPKIEDELTVNIFLKIRDKGDFYIT